MASAETGRAREWSNGGLSDDALEITWGLISEKLGCWALVVFFGGSDHIRGRASIS